MFLYVDDLLYSRQATKEGWGEKKQMEKQLYRRLVFSCYFEKNRYIMNIKNFIKG